MRRPLVVGNWKMHGTAAGAAELARAVAKGVGGESGVEVGICPPMAHLAQCLQLVAGSAVTVGGQDCSEHSEGAYTGEVSAGMLAELGCRWVLLGHSERRAHFGESDALIARKWAAARTAGLTPIVCVGESLAEREAGKAEEAVRGQLAPLLEAGLCGNGRGAGRGDGGGDVIAYEPVWAIGTGKTASPEQAQAMHAFIRSAAAERAPKAAAAMRVLYGGSVKADNAAALFAAEDIDGGLIGGAALNAEAFIAIVKAAAAS